MTVRKYIGPQGFRKNAVHQAKPAPPPEAPSQKQLLSVSEQTLTGAVASYVLSPKQGIITAKAPTVDILLSFKDAVLLVEEFQEAIIKMAEMEAK